MIVSKPFSGCSRQRFEYTNGNIIILPNDYKRMRGKNITKPMLFTSTYVIICKAFRTYILTVVYDNTWHWPVWIDYRPPPPPPPPQGNRNNVHCTPPTHLRVYIMRMIFHVLFFSNGFHGLNSSRVCAISNRLRPRFSSRVGEKEAIFFTLYREPNSKAPKMFIHNICTRFYHHFN